jgi:hypothetical protein
MLSSFIFVRLILSSPLSFDACHYFADFSFRDAAFISSSSSRFHFHARHAYAAFLSPFARPLAAATLTPFAIFRRFVDTIAR